jgi:hypothetical protein
MWGGDWRAWRCGRGRSRGCGRIAVAVLIDTVTTTAAAKRDDQQATGDGACA